MGNDYGPSRRRIFLSRNMSSFAAEQFYNDAALEAVDRRASKNSENWQWTTDRYLLCMAMNDRAASTGQLATLWSTTTGILISGCNVNCVQGCLYAGFPSRQTIDGCVCNRLISTDPSMLIGTNLSFQMNHSSI
ncbi:uncharacterized protein TNCV_3645751 [Trichonephila clavipes]|nr:uncharacterized protein TNCV_1566501 [Trichonephila clavipes]GFX69369.1 uncharacterized protein TNCV_3645751 [Trichonephila clavipes]